MSESCVLFSEGKKNIGKNLYIQLPEDDSKLNQAWTAIFGYLQFVGNKDLLKQKLAFKLSTRNFDERKHFN